MTFEGFDIICFFWHYIRVVVVGSKERELGLGYRLLSAGLLA